MKNEALALAIVGGIFGLLGNVITSFGPSWVSWHQKPEFVDTPTYKAMREISDDFEDRLKTRLSEKKYAIKERRAELKIIRREGARLIMELTQTSDIVNLSKEDLPIELRGSMQDGTHLVKIEISPFGQETKYYNEESLSRMAKVNQSGGSVVQIPYEIAPSKTAKTKTVYKLIKPLSGIEPLVADRVILGTYRIDVVVDESLRDCKPVDYESFTFDSAIAVPVAGNTTTFELKGPLLPGQGIGVHWACP